MLLSREYVQWLERLPCNRHARRRQQKHGQWLDGWVQRDETPLSQIFHSDQDPSKSSVSR